MRIISGKYKARRIQVPANIKARPTTDFAKEGLFNLLNNRIDFEGIEMLDLFAGTGGIGLEFISRNCKSVTSVDINATQTTFIHKNCSELGIKNMLIHKADVFRFINNTSQKFDFIFADPPYDLKSLATIPDLIFERRLLKEDGIFVLEHSAKNDFSEHPNFAEHRHYGNVNFSFFENK